MRFGGKDAAGFRWNWGPALGWKLGTALGGKGVGSVGSMT